MRERRFPYSARARAGARARGARRGGLAAAFVATGASFLVALGLSAPAASATQLSFVPVADAKVKSSSPGTNYGSANDLQVRQGDASNPSTVHTYLRFTLSGIGGPVLGARLRLWVTDGSVTGGSAFAASNDYSTGGPWSESGVTWNNAPLPAGAALSTLGAVTAGTWAQFDVTPAVSGDGTYTFELVTSSSNSAVYSSREAANAPVLVVDVGDGTPVAPTASFTALPTSGQAPLQVAFTDTSTGAPTAWAWDFDGDAVVDSTAQNPSFTYQTAGTYTVTLTASNLQGSSQASTQITVNPPAPLAADFTASPLSGTAPLQVQFTDASSGSPTGWQWDFDNDGTVDSTSRNPAFTYTAPGTYSVKLTVTNGLDPPSSTTKQNLVTVSQASGQTVTVMVAGDIACDPADTSFNGGLGTSSRCRQKATSDLVLAQSPDAVFALGDLQYENGTLSAFNASYDPSWGRFSGITYPSVGNHEYQTAGATGYYTYWGARAGDPSKGYYSFDIGSWHVVVLNSNCGVVSCKAGSAQETWLRNDLAAHPNGCTLAYWHHPRFHGNGSLAGSVLPFWNDLYAAGAELVLNGHYHRYERWAPQTPSGAADPATGIRELVVGTGGKDHGGSATLTGNLQVFNGQTFGVLELTLAPGSYSWTFLPVGSTFTDSGSGTCH